jgi:8-oxo-dGTP pyrophosphatase MutT (NUDIX family)
VLATTRVMTLKQRWCASPTNPAKAGHYVYLDACDWCNVVAITRDRRVVMIEQFRHGLGEVTLELAGGIVERGEDPAAAGVRELLEETGYSGTSHGVIGTVSANPAIFNNRVHTVLVTDCKATRAPEMDGNEEIATRLVELGQLDNLVRRSDVHHSLVVCAWMHARLWGVEKA